MLNYIEYLGIPLRIAFTLAIIFFGMQIIGECLEFKGKVVPEFMKVRKFFARKRTEKKKNIETLEKVEKLLNDVNEHYSADNITKRDDWIDWVNSRVKVYDDSIIKISQNLSEVIQALNANTRLTEELFVQQSRDRIIDFSHRAADHDIPVSREEFNRIFKVYAKYEKFLEEHYMTNGEIDIVYGVIKESYKWRTENKTFIEDKCSL